MPVTAQQIQSYLVLEVGETDPPTLQLNVADIWSRFADKASIAPRLQELYVKRALIYIALGAVRLQANVALPGVSNARNQFTTHLLDMLKETQSEITLRESPSQRSSAGVVAAITAFEPVSPPVPGTLPSGPLDAGSSRYSGDPYKRGYGPPR